MPSPVKVEICVLLDWRRIHQLTVIHQINCIITTLINTAYWSGTLTVFYLYFLIKNKQIRNILNIGIF